MGRQAAAIRWRTTSTTSPEGFRVIAPDLRGLGSSEHVTEALPSAWVADLVGLLDRLGIPKAHVYGVSLGARVALRFGIDHPDRTMSLILDAAVVLMEGGGDSALNANFDVSKMPQDRKDNYKVLHGDDWEQVVINYFNFRNNPEFQEQLNLPQVPAGRPAPHPRGPRRHSRAGASAGPTQWRSGRRCPMRVWPSSRIRCRV